MKRIIPLLSILFCGPAWAQNAVKVHVIDAQDAPVAAATVEALIMSKPEAHPVGTTDARGDVTLDLVQDPTQFPVPLLIWAKGFAFTGATSKGAPLVVRLSKGATWRGRVVDEEGRPVSGAKVSVTGAALNSNFPAPDSYARLNGSRAIEGFTAITGAGGEFEIAGLPPRGLHYRVSTAKFAELEGQGMSTDVPVELKLVLGGRINGRLIGVDGKPVGKVQVYVDGNGTNGAPNTLTDEDGRFSIGPLFPTTYSVRFRPPYKAQFLVPPVDSIVVAKGETKELAESRAVDGILVTGTVTDAKDGTPVERVQLSIESAGEYRQAGTDAKGQFSIRCLPGTHSFSIARVPPGYVGSEDEVDLQIGNKAPARIEFKIDKIGPTKGILRGVILDEGGQPIAASVATGSGFKIQSDNDGKWEIDLAKMHVRGDAIALASDEGEDAFNQLISPQQLNLREEGDVTIKIRKKPWLVMAGRALKTDGTPLQGANIIVNFGSTMANEQRAPIIPSPRTAVTDAKGEFTFRNIPSANDSGGLTVSGSRTGYAFRSGGKVSKNGPVWQVGDLVFVPLNRKISGTTEAGARVVADGQEIVADTAGKFAFEELEEGDSPVFAAKGDRFGGGIVREPFVIELTKPAPQGVDMTLARQAWAELAHEAAGTNYRMAPWAEAYALGGEERDAQFEKLAGRGDQVILALLGSWNWKGETSLLTRACSLIKDPELRLGAYLNCAAKNDDPELGKTALQMAEVAFAKPVTPFIERENNLYAAVPVAARFGGEKAGFAALDRAVNFTYKNHGSKSRSPTGWTLDEFARDSVLNVKVPVVVRGGLPLLRRLMSYIEAEPSSGAHAYMLSSAVPIVARHHGLEAALPLLKELDQLPETVKRENRDGVTPTYGSKAVAFDTYIPYLLPAMEKAPEQALQLARRVRTNYNRIPALAAAALLQTGAEAEALWLEIVNGAEPEDAAMYAAWAWEKDKALGEKLFAIARQRVSQVNGVSRQGEIWSKHAFYFYYARVNPAEARLMLEREWGQVNRSGGEKRAMASLAIAMSAIDGNRALEMASSASNERYITPFMMGFVEEFEGFEARRKIGEYLAMPLEKRRFWIFKSWRDSGVPTWDAL